MKSSGLAITRILLPGLIFSILHFNIKTFGQDSTIIIPDGTQGETIEINVKDTLREPLTLSNWYQFDGPSSTLKLGGGFLYEYATFIQDDISKEQINMNPGFKMRDFRITLSGKIKTDRFITWKAGIMYDAPSSSWLFRESGVMVGVPEISSHFFVGRTKEGFSLNKVMNGYAGWTMERQIALDAIPILADGIKWMGYLPKQRFFWNIGIFTDWLSEFQTFSTYDWQFASRVGWLPFYSETTNSLMHVAVSYRYGKPDNGEIQLKSRPEAIVAPYFLDTEKFPAESSNHFGGEIYFSKGPFLIGSENYVHAFSSAEKGNPQFRGGDVVATYIITGESRPYSTVSGIYGFVPVKNSVFDGGPGTWEIVLRYSTLDLNDAGISGGQFWRFTPMINWYLSKNIRLELAYGYGELDRFEMTGATQFFQSRIQLIL